MKRIFITLLAVLMVFALAACGKADSQESNQESNSQNSTSSGSKLAKIPKDDLKVGFIYIGKIDDKGYNESHDQGRIMFNDMGITTVYREDIKDKNSFDKTVKELVEENKCNVIYSTSAEFIDWVKAISKKYDSVYFEQCASNESGGNVRAYFGRLYEARYLSGIVAAKRTQTNKLGYVAAFDNNEVNRSINAFTLGAKSINPDIQVEVIYTNSWADPEKERAAANKLIDLGADVLAQSQDTTTTQEVAQDRKVFCIGQNYTAYNIAPDAYLTGVLFNWKEYYKDSIQQIIDGIWSPNSYWGSLKDGIVRLDTLAQFCGSGTKEAVRQAEDDITSGKLQPFTGPINDNHGKLRVESGVKLSDDEIWNIDWLVEGVHVN